MTIETAPTNTTCPTVERRPTGTTPRISGAINAMAIAVAAVGMPIQVPMRTRTSGGNVTVTVQAWDVGAAILTAISDLHDRLLARSRALPTEAMEVLYANLWDLYVD